jgi:hypothetical protein
MKRLMLLLSVAVWALTACGGDSGGGTTPVPDPAATIIPATTKVTDADTRAALSAYDRATGLLRFRQSTPTLTALKPGDVLVSEPSAAAPDGYLRRVTAIRSEGGETVLDTTQAAITDAVSQGVLDAHMDLKPANIQRTDVFVQGVTVTSGAARLGAQDQVGIGENYAFSVKFNHVFVPQAGPNVSGNVTIDGSVSYNVGLGVYIAVSGPSFLPPRLISVGPVEAKVGFAQQASLHISGDVVGDLGDELKFATQYYEPLTFFIGPVPVVVVPRLDLYLSAGGRVEGKFDFQASESAVAQLGARWTPDDGWKNISDFDFSGDVPRPTVSGTVRPSGGVKSTFGFKLYDVAGPEMSLLGGLVLDGQIPRNPNWIVTGFLKGNMNFKVELPILGTLANYQVTLFDKSLEFSRAGNTPPTLTLTDLAKPSGIVVIGGAPAAFLGLRAPVFMGNGCVTFGGFPVVAYFIASDLEDGCSVQVAVVSDKDGPLPTSGKYAFTTEGPRRITVTVRDSQGTAASKGFNLYVLNAPPTLTLQNSGDAYQGEGYSVAAQVSDANEADASTLCARTVWSVDAPDTLANQTGCLQTVIFGTTGARQVRATTTDSDGAATAQKLSVNVLPPPANPYPRISGKGVYSLDSGGSGAFRFCADVPVTNGSTIDLSQDGCTRVIVGDPPRRFSARVAVENPQNEALTYDWTVTITYPGGSTFTLLSETASPLPAARLSNPTVNGVPITGPATTDTCAVTVKVNAPDSARSKGPITVWAGRCTYISPNGPR